MRMKKGKVDRIVKEIDDICTRWNKKELEGSRALQMIYDRLWDNAGSIFNRKSKKNNGGF